MRQVKRWRYYCDHCRKAGGSKGPMVSHEAGCTNNPNRACRVCELAAFDAAPLLELVEFVKSRAVWHYHDEDGDRYHGEVDSATIGELRTLADGCPVCMFAAMRQGKVFPKAGDDKFDLKTEMVDVWKTVNENRYEGVALYAY